MRIQYCGQSGLTLSELGLGTLTWGRDTDQHEAQEMLTAFVDSGGSAIEISPTHGDGQAVSVLAHAMPIVGRHRLVIMWRGGAHLGESSQWIAGSSRNDMLNCLDDALQRMRTDHVDLWLIEPTDNVPLEETLSAVELAWRSGRTRYVGISDKQPWRSATIVAHMRNAGIPVVALQHAYSLLERSAEKHLLIPAVSQGLGIIACSPLAGGVLTGKYLHSTPPDSRAASPHLRHLVSPYLTNGCQSIVSAVSKAADGLDRSTAHVALAWLRYSHGTACSVIGPRTMRQLEQLLDLHDDIPPQIRRVLNEVSTPQMQAARNFG